MIVPSPRRNLDSEIEQLWNQAIQEQLCQLAKIIITYFEDGTMYSGEYFKGTIYSNGTLSREGLLFYERELNLGKKSGEGLEQYTQIIHEKIIPTYQISGKDNCKLLKNFPLTLKRDRHMVQFSYEINGKVVQKQTSFCFKTIGDLMNSKILLHKFLAFGFIQQLARL